MFHYIDKNANRVRRAQANKHRLVLAEDRPRFLVDRSNRFFYVQVIDSQGKTLFTMNSRELDAKGKKYEAEIKKIGEQEGKGTIAFKLGYVAGKEIGQKKIQKIAFDRNGHKYHGNIAKIAEGCRAAGISF